MNVQVNEFAGILIAVVLAVDSLLHVYWSTGRIWPLQDQLSLSQAVLNSNKTRLFRPATLLPLAFLLFLGALTVLARVHRLGMLGELIPELFLQLGIYMMAAGFLIIALLGIVKGLRLVEAKSKLYYKLNLFVYTPACLVLFAAAVIVLRS